MNNATVIKVLEDCLSHLETDMGKLHPVCVQAREAIASMQVMPNLDLQAIIDASESFRPSTCGKEWSAGFVSGADYWRTVNPAPEKSVLLDPIGVHERFIALLEAHHCAAERDYFDARPQIDTKDRRNVFEAGFGRGFQARDSLAHDEGMCRSCVNNKCVTGPECVTLGRDATQPPQDERTAEPAQPVALSTLTDDDIEQFIYDRCRRFVTADMIPAIRELAASAPAQQAIPPQPVAAESPTQKGIRATLAVQGLSKAFDGLGAGRKDRKMIVTDEMVNRFLMWKLPADFAPDCGISFKSESEYEHPVFGRSKHEPMGTNLFHADQVRSMLEHVLMAGTGSDESAKDQK